MSDTARKHPDLPAFATDRLLSVPQVAALLCVHPKAVGKLIRAGKLDAKRIRIAGAGIRPNYRIALSAVERFIDALPDSETSVSPSREPKRVSRSRRALLPGVVRFV